MPSKFFQDYYPDNYSHCYGCGRLNEKGMHIKSFWDGDEAVCFYTPALYHTGGSPGHIYGGTIASVIDCHCAGTAAAAKHKHDGFEPGEGVFPRFVTASLKVDYLEPTPTGAELKVAAKILEIRNRRVILSATVTASGVVTAKGEAVMVQLPEGV